METVIVTCAFLRKVKQLARERAVLRKEKGKE